MSDSLKFSVQEIRQALGTELVAVHGSTGSPRTGSTDRPEFVEGRSATGISIDSRTLKPGELYVAIRGRRFDGHDFAGLALTQGSTVTRNVQLP